MRKYETPELELTPMMADAEIAASGGIITDDGDWDL